MSTTFGVSELKRALPPTYRKIKTRYNVHRDDIHACVPLGPDRFVSGSKDGSLKIWDPQGKLICAAWDPEKVNYNSWITAIAPGPNFWISGTRDCYVDAWTNEGERWTSLEEPEQTQPKDHKCKERNKNRVNCITVHETFQGGFSYFVGRPTKFTLHRFDGQRVEQIGECVTSVNDWVYCIHQLALNRLLIVTGANLDVWEKEEEEWIKTASPVDHPFRPQEQQRPFISAITPLEDAPHLFGLAVFDGSVKVVDVETQEEVFWTREHKNRVWTVENFGPHTFASCGDDHTVKLWDLRIPQSTLTLTDHVGRVSTLLKRGDHTLVAGSCPDNPTHAKTGAQFTFWDVRRMEAD